MILDELRKRIAGEEFDYQMLMQSLRSYRYPRAKISALLKSKAIIRIKKGLYVFGDGWARRPVSREVLANLIYGPSYISLDYALHFHGLIPERVERLTCCTWGRARLFTTPVGIFSYRPISHAAYAIGVDQFAVESGDLARRCLMAVPEKALADKLAADRRFSLIRTDALRRYVVDDLRLELKRLAGMDAALMAKIASAYDSPKIYGLVRLIRLLRKGKMS
jgi:hypothetical protein